MKLKRLLALPLFAILLVLPFSGCALIDKALTPTPHAIDNGIEVCERVCKFDLSEDAIALYAARSVHWDCYEYEFAFAFTEEPTEFIADFSYSDGTKDSLERSKLTFVSDDGVPSEAVADWTKPYMLCQRKVETSYGREEYVYMAYFPDEMKLFVNILLDEDE